MRVLCPCHVRQADRRPRRVQISRGRPLRAVHRASHRHPVVFRCGIHSSPTRPRTSFSTAIPAFALATTGLTAADFAVTLAKPTADEPAADASAADAAVAFTALAQPAAAAAAVTITLAAAAIITIAAAANVAAAAAHASILHR